MTRTNAYTPMAAPMFAALADPLLLEHTEPTMVGGALLEYLAEEHGGRWAERQDETAAAIQTAYEKQSLPLLEAALKMHQALTDGACSALKIDPETGERRADDDEV